MNAIATTTLRDLRDELPVVPRTPLVLLAEDDARMRRLLAAALRLDGFEVVEAKDGAELLEGIGNLILHPRDGRVVDLVITDVRMPFTTGLDVVAGLRRAEWITPVIVITAFGDEATHAEAQRLGAVAVFDKPFDVNELRIAALHHASK